MVTDRDAGNDWRDTLVLPDRTVVRGRGVRHAVPAGAAPEFGLYLGVDYAPTWPHETVEWPNYGLPEDDRMTAQRVEELYGRARRDERVEVACWAGRGRTGTVIACLAILAGLEPTHAVSWVRHHYDHRAVRAPWQRRWVVRFPALLSA
jgi:hypothetical protein